MSDLYVTATIVTTPDKADALRDILLPVVDQFRAEDGCLAYTLLEDQEEPGRFFTYECWRDRAALDAHMSSKAMKAIEPTLGDYLTQALDQHFLSALKIT